MTRLAIVVPVHNGVEHTRRCIASLDLAGVDAPLYVVDDGSTDGTHEFLFSRPDRIRIVPGTGDLWWSGGVNRGCAAAIADGASLLLLLNNDNIVASNLVAELVATYDETGACVSAPVLTTWSGDRGVIMTAGGTLDWRMRGIGLVHHGDEYTPQDVVTDADWLPGAPLLFSASLFEELNGFDERRFPQYRGDVDFTLRARQRGNRCVVTWRTWVLNDQTQTGVNFARRVTPAMFLRGLVTLRSNYNLRETVAFARTHCPLRYRARYLVTFYLRYAYASLKTYLPSDNRAGAR